jgi:hypothetical protein
MPEVTYNGQQYSTESQIGKEALKHERPHNYRPENHPYPRMLYKAKMGDDGIVRADAGVTLGREYFASDQAYESAVKRDDAFNNSCRTIVGTEREHQMARDNGWRDSAEEAIEFCKFDYTIRQGTAAAERLYRDRNMSEKAKSEAKAADDATPLILPEIPEAKTVKNPYSVAAQVAQEAKLDKRTKAYKDSLKQAS